MTAPVTYPAGGEPLDRTETAPAERPDGTAPVKLLLAVEGIDTSDGRHIAAGALGTRPMPLTLYAQVRSTHGAEGDAATYVVGAITEAERVPGPEITQRSTGQPFQADSYAWVGRGWMYTDVPGPESGSKPAYTLMRDGALYGNSIDLTEVDAELEYADGSNDGPPSRITVRRAVIGSTTLVGIPAFMDAFVECDGDLIAAPTEALVAAADALETGARLSFRSAELGDHCTPCGAHRAWLDDFAVSAAKRKKATDAGHAMPDGSYPIETAADLDNAIRAVGRAGGAEGTDIDRNAVRRHIIKQAKRLNLDEKIPDTWNGDGTLKTATASLLSIPFADLLSGEDIAPPDHSTSGMIALVPDNAQQLAVPGGDPAQELHLTLAYLGDNVTAWSPDEIGAVHQVAREATDPDAFCARVTADARARGEQPGDCEMLAQQPGWKPLLGNVFAHAVFNPNGTPDGQQPATVYLLDGDGDRNGIESMAAQLCREVRDAVGAVAFPDQHPNFEPHITAGYNLPVAALDYTGPVRFSSLVVAIGNQRTYYPLGGGAPVVAAGTPLPHIDMFSDPKLTEPTPHTVTDHGRVYGHLALWDTCHTGRPGQCTTPPRNRDGSYAYFQVHSTQVLDHDGETVTIPVGYGTLSRDASSGGHADARILMSASEVAKHYDNTGTVFCEIAVGEDDHGIWYSGRLLPGLTERDELLARGATFSGDWRMVRGGMELVAALAVVTPGFPVTRVRMAGGHQVALTASGLPPAAPEAPGPIDMDALVNWVRGQQLADEARQYEALLLAALMDPHGPEQQFLAEVDTILALETDLHPWLGEFPFDDDAANIGEFKLHLPPYIKRIAKHLKGKGMAQGRAIATAVNAAKKMCATGDTNWPGSQQVNAGSRAEACTAVAQWRKDRPGAT